MREIKFRAWDKENKKMLYEIPLATVNFYSSLEEFFKHTELMQYTGLKDKNGKEIYEGDVVKSVKEYNGYSGILSDMYGGHIYEVKNNGWEFYFTPEPITNHHIDTEELEVIGNIYENPELVKFS